ncbi:MAG: ribonuclease III [Clostridiales bacterium]|nr:ribonuclease III [Clostridiales bacterium]
MLEDLLGYTFKNKSLLEKALTHSSYANEKGKGRQSSNERLEFLGDSVLGFFVAEHLFKNNKNLPEGDMTRLRAELVCEQSLVKVANKLNLGDYLRLGKGEEQGGGRKRASILADAVEAVLAAIYLDGGKKNAQKFVLDHLLTLMDEEHNFPDHKTALQELVQKKGGESPTYKLAGESGPDHQKVFYSEVWIKGNLAGKGSGRSKKEAEQAAAGAAIRSLSE